MNEHHVYFAIFDFDEDPQLLTLQIGIEPDHIQRIGDSITPLWPEAQYRQNRWIISSQLDHTASHRDHFEKLLLKLKRIEPQLATLRQQYRCGIGVSQYFFMDDPWFYLPDEIIEGYLQLGFEISFDQLGIDKTQKKDSSDTDDA